VNDLMRAALYTRTVCPAESADDQLGTLECIAEARGWAIIARVHDLRTGTESTRSARPALDALLAEAARHEFDVVAVRSLAQLGRSVRDVIDVISELHKLGIDIYSHEDNIDTTTVDGKAALAAFAALGRCERDMMRERAKISLAKARRSGVRLGRPSNLNASVNAAIVALRERGFSIRRIASELRVGNRSVYAALEAAGVTRGTQNADNGFGTPQKSPDRARNGTPA
jgi:DNA invertase Pin-like site-specific DNA recombinase